MKGPLFGEAKGCESFKHNRETTVLDPIGTVCRAKGCAILCCLQETEGNPNGADDVCPISFRPSSLTQESTILLCLTSREKER